MSEQHHNRYKRAVALTVAGVLLPFAFLTSVALDTWQAWHDGPSTWILRFFRWLNYRAFKRVSRWVVVNAKSIDQ